MRVYAILFLLCGVLMLATLLTDAGGVDFLHVVIGFACFATSYGSWRKARWARVAGCGAVALVATCLVVSIGSRLVQGVAPPLLLVAGLVGCCAGAYDFWGTSREQVAK